MARMKFLCDAERCIECNGCVTACKNEHDIPWGVNRRRVITLDDGSPGEKSISVACMHCTDAPCQAVCPVDCFYTTDDGIVYTTKISVSVVATVSMPARSEHLSILVRKLAVPSVRAAKWTNVRFALVGRKMTSLMRNMKNTVVTVSPRVHCHYVQRCVLPRH